MHDINRIALLEMKRSFRGNKTVRDLREDFDVFANFISPYSHPDLLNFVKRYPYYYDNLILKRKAGEYSDLIDRLPVNFTDRRKAIHWYALLIIDNKEQIIEYMSNIANVDSLIFSEDFIAAKDHLDFTNKIYGHTTLGLFKYIYINRLTKSEDDFFEFIDQIVGDLGPIFPSFLAREWSKIFSSSFSEKDFRMKARNLYRAAIKEDSLRKFVEFWCLGGNDAVSASPILSSASRSSVFDIFVVFYEIWSSIKNEINDESIIDQIDNLITVYNSEYLKIIRSSHNLNNNGLEESLNSIMFYGLDNNYRLFSNALTLSYHQLDKQNILYIYGNIFRFTPISNVIKYATERINDRSFEILNNNRDLISSIREIFISPLIDVEKFSIIKDLVNKNYDSSAESKYYECINYTREGQFNKALEILESLPNEREFNYLRAYLLGILGRKQEFIKYVAKLVSEDIENAKHLPLKTFLKVKYSNFSHLSGNIELSIALHALYLIDPDRQNIRNLRYAWQDYIRFCGIKYSSELPHSLESKSSILLSYFWKNICIESIMVFDKAFASQREVENERVRIFANLIKISENDELFYRQEILKLTTKHKIEDELKRIDKSRIFVDVGMIMVWAKNNIADSFNRIKVVFKRELQNVVKTVKNLEDSPRKSPKGEQEPLIVYVNYRESQGIFDDMVNSLANTYLSDKQFGLDAYMSMRIRHGSFSGNIRSPLQNSNMIASMDELEQYQYNTNWMKNGLDSNEDHELQQVFIAFSKKFDLILENFTGELLRVKNDNKPNGFFYIELPKQDTRKLTDIAIEGNSLEEFVNESCESFKKNINVRLEEVRNHIVSNLAPQIEDLYSQLRIDVMNILNPHHAVDFLKNYEFAKRELSNAIGRVADWFNFNSEFEKNSEFSFDEYISLFIKSASLSHLDFTPEIEKHIDVKSEYSIITIYRINDIIFTLLDNVYKHSGYLNPKVTLVITDSDGKIKIEFTSPIKSNSHAINAKVAAILESISQGESIKELSNEGNTGLKKIANVAKISGGQLNNVFITPDNLFTVSLIVGNHEK